MAGGKNAEVVACPTCIGRAKRDREGLEDDHYRCDKGHEFSVAWPWGPPDTPQWPPSTQLVQLYQGLI